MQTPLNDETEQEEAAAAQLQNPPTRSPQWLETFHLHFDLLRDTSNTESDLNAAYSEQRATDANEQHTNAIAIATAQNNSSSRSPSPLKTTRRFRSPSPVFLVHRSRSGTPILSTSSVSREPTPTTSATFSRASTPVMSLDMDDPVQAATALAWLQDAVMQVDPSTDVERFKELVVVPLACDPGMDREVLFGGVVEVDLGLEVALRMVLGRVEWGGEDVGEGELEGDEVEDGGKRRDLDDGYGDDHDGGDVNFGGPNTNSNRVISFW